MADSDTAANGSNKPGKDSVPIKGQLTCTLKDKDGKVKKSLQVKNLVVADGRELIAALLAQDGSSFPSHMAVGTSATSPSLLDSALLGTELGRVALSSTVASGKDTTYSATFSAGTGTGTIEEMGIFNDGTAGTMLCRVGTGTLDKGPNDSLDISWTLTIG